MASATTTPVRPIRVQTDSNPGSIPGSPREYTKDSFTVTDEDCAKIFDVIIIGQGWSGILGLKHCLQEGLDALGVESRDGFGGIWYYQEAPGGVARSTQTTSSMTVTEISDHPLDFLDSDFAHQWDVFTYLKSYVRRFHLLRNQRFKFETSDIRKIDGIWHVSNGVKTLRTRRICISSGMQNYPNMILKDKLFSNYTGKIIHSYEYKEPKKDYNDKTVLIIGGGESASDQATEISYHSEQVYMSVPRGQWFGTRYDELTLPNYPLEHFSTRLRRWILPGNDYPEVFEMLRAATEKRQGFQGHGLEIWRTDFYEYGNSIINKNTDVLKRIYLGRVTPKPNVKSSSGKTVHFVDGTSAEIDIVIIATGFALKWPYLKGYENMLIRDFYKLCMVCEDPSIGLIGMARPTRGSFPSISESQARWLAKIWSGKVPLPDYEERIRIRDADREQRDRYFHGANRRVQGLVDMFGYNDHMAQLCGVYPNWWKLFLESPRKWFIGISAPYHHCQYLVNDKRYHAHVFDRWTYFGSRAPMRILIFAATGQFLYLWTKLKHLSSRFPPLKLLNLAFFLYLGKNSFQSLRDSRIARLFGLYVLAIVFIKYARYTPWWVPRLLALS